MKEEVFTHKDALKECFVILNKSHPFIVPIIKKAIKKAKEEERKEMALRIADLVVKKEIDKLIGEEVKKRNIISNLMIYEEDEFNGDMRILDAEIENIEFV